MNYTPDWLRPIDNHYLTVSRQRILDMPKRLAGHLGYTQSISALGDRRTSAALPSAGHWHTSACPCPSQAGPCPWFTWVQTT